MRRYAITCNLKPIAYCIPLYTIYTRVFLINCIYLLYYKVHFKLMAQISLNYHINTIKEAL